MSKKRLCEFCGRKTYTASTTFFSNYCIDCLEIVIEQTQEAIKEVKESPK